MVLLIIAKNNTMKNTISSEQNKVRTTLYLTPENKQGLDRIPRGQKTALMNKAIGNAREFVELTRSGKKFIEMITQISPVKTELSSDVMVQHLREGKEIPST